MSGVKYSRNGKIIRASINPAEIQKINIIFAGVCHDDNFRVKSKVAVRRIVGCFETEDMNAIGTTEVFASSINETKIRQTDIDRMNLPGTSAIVCLIHFLPNTQTQYALTAFSEKLKEINGPNWQFRVLCAI
jgi:hypothetical protein